MSDAPAVGRSGRRSRPALPAWLVPLLLGAVCLLVYNVNFRSIAAGDTLPARYLPLVVWHDKTLSLDGNAPLVAHGHPLKRPPKTPPGTTGGVTYFGPYAYWLYETHDQRTASLYPVVAPLLVTPLYLPAKLYLDRHGWKQPTVDRVSELMEKFTASLLAALASVLFYLLLRREKIPWALPLAVAFAFGTNTWVISSQALWQHGSGELLVTLGLLLALGRRTPARMAALGFTGALIAANRPPDLLIAAALLLFAAWRERRDVRWLAAGALLPALALLVFNLTVTGHLFGGYANTQNKGHFFRFDPLGVLGLLVSPGRGLLIFTPFLVFVGVGLARRLREDSTRRLALLLSAAVLAQLVLYSQTDWRAGSSWGPRWLTDLLPILLWMLAPAPQALRPVARRALAVTMVAGIAVQAVGAFWYTGVSDERIFAGGPGDTAAAWKPANTPFLVELGHRPATGTLRCGGRGYVERIGETLVQGNGAVAPLKAADPIEGWALTCDRAPAQVLALIDGVVVGATTTFVPRPDVSRAQSTSAATGWRMEADTRGVTPGRHTLQLAMRVTLRSDARILREEQVDVAPSSVPLPGASLSRLAARAAERLKADQSPEGYWLTTFTSGTRYRAPAKELNTYTTAVLDDLLDPIADAPGVAARPALAAARRHLRAQIEPNGLVRYHGLPDAPTIGTLGCRITPDADDTALSWRIAGLGRKDPRARRMLRTLARYRDARGLYRTWLAPQRRYECIDPGRDPNPPDIVNQMHVYLMLRQLDPPAGRRLCTAIQRAARADEAFVYYDRTPLVPYLRSAQLATLGCPLPLPSARLARPAAGQEPWAELVRRLVATLGGRPGPADRRAIGTLLRGLAENDFLALRLTPPLIYHNDLTATVSRFYWSEDVGYALWLRLYEATLPPAP